MSVVSDAGTVFAREMMPVLRNPIGLLFTMVQPVVFLLLFGPLLGGVPESGPSAGGSAADGPAGAGAAGGGTPWEWFVPGILVMLALYSTTGAGYSLLTEIGGGSLERMLVTPLNRSAMLVGRALKEVVALLGQAMLIVAAAVPFGMRPRPVGILGALALLAVFGVGLGALTFALALAARRQQELFFGVQQLLLFPLLLLAGVFLPVEAAPAWLAAASTANPVTYLVDAERALFAGVFLDASVLLGALVAVATATVGLAAGTRAMRTVTL